ncbi:MAG: DNA polymerase III subunit alpha, partial [Ignavibacterium sp.]
MTHQFLTKFIEMKISSIKNILAASAIAALITACGEEHYLLKDVETAQGARVKFIHAAPDAPGVALFVNDKKFSGVITTPPATPGVITYGNVYPATDYAIVEAGAAKARLTVPASSTAAEVVLFDGSVPVEADKYYSVFATGIAPTYGAVIIPDNIPAFNDRQLFFRVVNMVPNSTAVGLTLAGNTIAEKVEFYKLERKIVLPVFPLPEGFEDENQYLEHLTYEGARKKYGEITPEVKARLDFELSVIRQMGFSGYFLVVQDFINAAKQNNIPVGPGRGSAAGSLVAYALGITNINPLDYNLLFERFLNPSRKSMPDIDVDFADDKRGEVIEYVKKKYGNNCVSQIVTFNTLSSKAVIRDVARVLKIPIPVVNKITKYIPSKFGKVYSIDQALAEVPELKWVKESEDEQIQNLIKYAKVLEGMNRNASKHAAGVVITPDDVSNYVPLATATSQEEIVTQFNMKDIETVGLLKMDFLGLRTLTIIRDALEMIKRNHNVEIDIDNIPLDDEKTYQLFWKGQTTGVFQFESAPMREYLKRLKPTTLNDLAAMNALYRPGPMEFIDDFIDRKFGRKEVKYDHPVLEPILKETYGVIVYQEQVIQIANKVAGMSLAEADILRRAMGKKDLHAMEEQKVKFIEGAIKNKIDKKIAEQIFDNIFKFANYGFNKSHAVAYSLVAYQTAYLKAHYPAEFLAANLRNEYGDTDKVTKFLEDCRKLKIPVLPPDVNRPSVFFDVVDEKIIFGMAAIKNVGIPAVREIINAKETLGRNFKSIYDFCINVDTRIVNKRALEGLILAGAFDSLHKNRAQLFNNVEVILDFAHKYQNSKLLTTESLFGGLEEIQISEPKLLDEKPWTQKEQLSLERKVVGFYITDHPLRKYETEYNSFATIH